MERSHRLLIYFLICAVGFGCLKIATPELTALLSTLGVGLVGLAILGVLGDCWLARHWLGEVRKAVRVEVRDAVKDSTGGLHLVTLRRRNNTIYLEWVNRTEPASFDMWGVSVFHRLEAVRPQGQEDLRWPGQRRQTIQDVIIDKVQKGWRIRALFVDPRATEAILQLSERESRGSEDGSILEHLRNSVRFCDELFAKMSGLEVPNGYLEIRVASFLPCEAYHRVDDDVIIGFYPAGSSGDDEPAYRAIGQPTIKSHQESFRRAFDAAKHGWLIRLLPANTRIERNNEAFDSIYARLEPRRPPKANAAD